MITNKAVARKVDGAQEVLEALLRHEVENEETAKAWLLQLANQITAELNKTSPI